MTTPLPSASPSALITIGSCNLPQKSSASSLSSNEPASAVGMRNLRIISLAKIFEDSKRAADFVGPKTRNPSAEKRSTTPAASGSSGPITVRSMRALLGETQQARQIIRRHRNVLAHERCPGISGSAKNLRDAR